MTQAAQIEELTTRIEALEARGPSPGGRCSSVLPHVGRLSFMRGPNLYMCECGQVYRKDGVGGLMEVVS